MAASSATSAQLLAKRSDADLTQSEIADRMGISQMHVSRLIRNSLDQIRDELERAERSAGPPG